MRLRPWLLLFLLMVLFAACSGPTSIPETEMPTIQPTNTLPSPDISVTRTPDVRTAVEAYLQAWQVDDYPAMYGMLSRLTLDAVTQENFTKSYTNVANALALSKVNYEILTLLTNPGDAQASCRVTLTSSLMGDFVRDILMKFSLENGEWRLQWDETMIMPELREGRSLVVNYTIPARGNIYDRNGDTLVAQTDAYALGIVPGQIADGMETRLLDEVSDLTGKTPQQIKALYENAGADWYIAVGEASAQTVNSNLDLLISLGGLAMTPFSGRYYFDGGVGPHVVGYVQDIPLEELDAYKRLGYRGDEKVGKSGLEQWGEQYLSGQRGLTLYVRDVNGFTTDRLSEIASKPAQEIYTTLDYNLQLTAQKALQGLTGAVVILERDTGRVLAMASSPGMDPNLFEVDNINSSWLLGDLLDPNTQPLLNRAAQSAYPLGSVFKIITMSAALESGLYTRDTSYVCGHTFTEGGMLLYDWTYEHEVAASGELNLPEGLMRSCNPYFWHIGLDLYQNGFPNLVSEMARGFGLGAKTGIEQLDESAGSMPDPTSAGEAVQLAIGQGIMLATPLQVANFIAALGNGGTLHRPQVIEKVTSLDGVPVLSFEPQVIGKLPISETTLEIVREGMRMVVANKRGTAYNRFLNVGVPIYGKTGTAQTSNGDPHAWFAGYTDANNPNKPDIAMVVFAENAGEGSEVAAPIFRRMVEFYFNGRLGPLYPWESSYYVTKTPKPDVVDTPQP
jgi:penicillin-binding protein 2